MDKRTLRDLDSEPLEGERALVRVDFNVSIHAKGARAENNEDYGFDANLMSFIDGEDSVSCANGSDGTWHERPAVNTNDRSNSWLTRPGDTCSNQVCGNCP